jgi:hypothetical protein
LYPPAGGRRQFRSLQAAISCITYQKAPFGVLLLEQGELDEALAVIQAGLKLWNYNMWGLLGLKQCLETQQKGGADTAAALAEAATAFKEASEHADSVPAPR